jgi:hypothetical protein
VIVEKLTELILEGKTPPTALIIIINTAMIFGVWNMLSEYKQVETKLNETTEKRIRALEDYRIVSEALNERRSTDTP